MNQKNQRNHGPDNIPELRFPEFGYDLSLVTIGNIATFSKGKGISKSDIDENGVLECIRYGELYTHYSEIIDEVFSRTNVSSDELVLSEANDVIIPASGETQIDIATASCVIREGIALGSDLNIIKSPLSGVYLSYYLNNARKKHIASLAQGISVVHLYASQLKSLSLNIPSLPEQQKIASFLTAVDERIQGLQKKKAKLEEYKKGVMQKLFNGEWKIENGKRVFMPPTFRFRPDLMEFEKLKMENSTSIFNSQFSIKNYPDWEERELGDLYDFKTTNSLSREKLNYIMGKVKNIHYGDIHTKYKAHFNISNEEVPFINDDVELSKIKKDSYLQEGDLVIADASENYADIGKSIEIVKLQGQNVVAGLHTFLARRKGNEIAVGFGGYLMQSFEMRLKIMRIAQGTKVLGISTSRMKPLIVLIPSRAEQQKIASFLSSIDVSIEKVRQQIEQSQVFKKGLLQKMFV